MCRLSSCVQTYVSDISDRCSQFLTVVGRVYKQVAYGKLFLTWDLPGFCNSDVVVAIQGRRISVLASRQAVATVFEWEEEQDCNIDVSSRDL